jgi:hypothetical protein
MKIVAFRPRLKHMLIAFSLAMVAGGANAATIPSNYLIVDTQKDLFVNGDIDRKYTVTDFNDLRMVCGRWEQKSPSSSAIVAQGIFVWRNGVMKHITIPGFDVPADRVSTPVALSGLMQDGSVILAADGNAEFDFPWPEPDPTTISRVLRIKINPNFAENTNPVISFDALKGYRITYDGDGKHYEEVETFTRLKDMSDDGVIIGSIYHWGYFNGSGLNYREDFLWGPSSTIDAFPGAGYLDYPDGNGYVMTYPNFQISERLYGGGAETPWRKPSGFEQWSGIQGVGADETYRLQNINGAYLAVWKTGFVTEPILIPSFSTETGLRQYRNPKTSITRDGHLLGSKQGNTSLAYRGTDDTYTVTEFSQLLASGNEKRRPQPPSGSTWYDRPVAINNNLDALAVVGGSGNLPNAFYVLSDYPNAGFVRNTTFEGTAAYEFEGTLSLSFVRELGDTGIARVTVSLIAGGTATPGQDFEEGVSKTVEWADGESGAKTVAIPITNDINVEELETVKVVLSNALGATITGGTEFFYDIYSDDNPATPTPTATPTSTPTPTPTPTPGPSDPPVITSAVTVNAQVGVAFSYQIVATNSPTSYLIIDPDGNTALPNGFVGDSTTGQITGTPAAAGSYFIWMNATNGAGSAGGKYLRIDVYAAGVPTPTPGVTPTPTPVATPAPAPPLAAIPEQPKLSGATTVKTTKSSYKVKGTAGTVPPGSFVEYKVGSGKKLKSSVKANGKFAFKAKLEDGKNVVKLTTVTPAGTSGTTKITIFKEKD